MDCPRCSGEKLSVIDSRSDGSSIRRRRECQQCSFRFTTYERIELTLPMVIKKDGSREPYDREKVKSGIVRSCQKRPVNHEQIEDMVFAVERQVQDLFVKEVPSIQVGEFVMDVLRPVDQVAYVRFASVYREFSDVSQFVDTAADFRPEG